MAQVLAKFEFKTRSKEATYPWGEWLNGKIWKLVQGKDYTSKTMSFQALARGMADKKGLGLKVSMGAEKGAEFCVLQSYELTDEDKEKRAQAKANRAANKAAKTQPPATTDDESHTGDEENPENAAA